MIRSDKYGNPIYPKVFDKLQATARKLEAIGYVEAQSKPNLFLRKYGDIVFFADMRGTQDVPLWRDPRPLIYPAKDESREAEELRDAKFAIELARMRAAEIDFRLLPDDECVERAIG